MVTGSVERATWFGYANVKSPLAGSAKEGNIVGLVSFTGVDAAC